MQSEISPHARKLTQIAFGALLVSFLLVVPYAKIPWLVIPPFIGAYDTTLVFISLLTALYFFCQYYRMNSRGMLILASSYLYDALMIVPHAMSYPGLFADVGLLGGSTQMTAWIYMFWHGGFPLCVMIYAMLDDKPSNGHGSLWRIIESILMVICLVMITTLMLVDYISYFPVIISHNVYTSAMHYVVGTVWGLGIVAMVLLWRRKFGSTTDLWLIVVMSSWLFDVALSSVFNHGRYDIGFYLGRAYGLIAAGFVLVMLIIETTRLNERLIAATTELADYADTLEVRVRQRTEELKHTEWQLAQSQKMEAIGNLTGGIAHDFNNLLNVIIGNLDVLCESTHGPDTHELLQDVMSAALRGRDMTKRLLAFARRQPLEPKRTDVNRLITNMFRLLHRTLKNDVTIDFDMDNALWPVEIDPGQLEDAITNLIANARDAMANGGQITVITSNQQVSERVDLPAGDYVVIEVRDTGTGIPAHVLEHIFEPFFTTKPSGKGTGLGLSMVFGFIKQSGGHITVSTSEHGTAFILYLPRA